MDNQMLRIEMIEMREGEIIINYQNFSNAD